MNQEQNQPGKANGNERPNQHAAPGQGQQGIDKAPGEEPMQENVQFSQDALKGKKVDGDPDQERDRPADQSSL